MLDISVGFGAVNGFQLQSVPLQFFTGAIGHIAQQGGLRERPGIIEIAGRGAAILDGFDPFLMVANLVLDVRFGLFEIDESRFWQ